MTGARRRILAAIFVVVLFVVGVFVAIILDSDFGRVEVTAVSIVGGDRVLCGLLYRPRSASAENPSPAVVLAHGIGGSKEMVSGIGLELARRGFVALCLDLFGHGGSEGTVEDGRSEPSFGVLLAVEYLKMQPYVDASAVGLVGHSLGGGAARAAVAQDGQIRALVLVAGGLGDVAVGPAYGVLNATFPKNLLVVIGEYDVLFNLTEVRAKVLPPVFGTQQEVASSVLYGSFEAQTARKLVTPATTHLFEPVDVTVVLETVVWMENAFSATGSLEAPQNLIYFEREVAILAVLAGLFGIVFLAFFPVARVFQPKPRRVIAEKEEGLLPDWRAYVVWGVLNLGLFLPVFAVGFVIMFPPLIFGASIAWWMFAVGSAGLVILAKIMPRFYRTRVRLKEALVGSFGRNDLLVALILFALFFVVVSLLEGVFSINLRIVSPVFRGLASARRVFAFLAFVPFFLAYFVAEGLYLHEGRGWKRREREKLAGLRSCGKAVLGKIAPFVAVICLQYLPIMFFNVWVLPRFVGFLVEFFWLIGPIFVITSTCSWWFYRNTGKVGTGAVFNALMMAWVASVVFPF